MSRKKQIEELKAQLEQLRADFVNAEGLRQEHTARLDTVEVMIDGHDSTLDNTAEMLRLIPPAESIARTDQMETFTTLTSKAVGTLQADLAAQSTAVAAQQSTVAAQQAALDEQHATVAAHQAALAEQQAAVAAQQAALHEQHATVAAHQAALDQQHATVAAHQAALDEQHATVAAHQAALAEQQTTVAAQQAALSEHAATISAQQAALDGQASVIAEQRALIDALQTQLQQLETSTTSETNRIQARLAEISEQLTRQVEELGLEVDAAARRAEEAAGGAASGAPVEALDEIKTAQVRLAAEQVRYDLALRAELAELAERLRRSNRG